MARFLILAHQHDSTALLVAGALLRDYGPGEVKLISLEELVYAPKWSHSLFSSCTANTVTLHDGTVLKAEDQGVVFCRLRQIDAQGIAPPTLQAREYAVMELHALLLSWLHSLRRFIVNRPSPQMLSGEIHSELGWHRLAGLAGLNTFPLRLTNSSRRYTAPGQVFSPLETEGAAFANFRSNAFVNMPARYTAPHQPHRCSALVAGSEVAGNVPSYLHPACTKLAQLAGVDILGIGFVEGGQSGQEWYFSAADSTPTTGDQAKLIAITRLLEARAAIS